jgi:hypothetical protein
MLCLGGMRASCCLALQPHLPCHLHVRKLPLLDRYNRGHGLFSISLAHLRLPHLAAVRRALGLVTGAPAWRALQLQMSCCPCASSSACELTCIYSGQWPLRTVPCGLLRRRGVEQCGADGCSRAQLRLIGSTVMHT